MTVLRGWRPRRRAGAFETERDGIARAVGGYYCLGCNKPVDAPVRDRKVGNVCGRCQGVVIYFPSKSEMGFAAGLAIRYRVGQITRLRFHPRYDLRINGLRVCTYVADAEYYEGDKLVVVDCKPPKFRTRESRLKIALFDAIHAPQGVKVSITSG